MIINQKMPPREFAVGLRKDIHIKDCGTVRLEPDEQVTFVTEGGGEYDLVRKKWGFCATPSLNARLLNYGLRAVLVKNRQRRYFMLLVESGKEALFEEYLGIEALEIVWWMDSNETLDHLDHAVRGGL